MDEGRLHTAVLGHLNRAQVARAVDELARHALIADTGERGAWARKGRLIVWRLA